MLPIQNRVVLNEDQLLTPSTTRQYPLGYQLEVVDETNSTTQATVKTYEYVLASAALAQYGVYSVLGNGSGIVAGVATAAGTAAYMARVIVPQTTVANGSYFFGVVRGACSVAETAAAGQNMTAGTQWKLVPGVGTTATPETVSKASATAPATVRQITSFGYSMGTSATSAGTMQIYVYGDPVMYNAVTSAALV